MSGYHWNPERSYPVLVSDADAGDWIGVHRGGIYFGCDAPLPEDDPTPQRALTALHAVFIAAGYRSPREVALEAEVAALRAQVERLHGDALRWSTLLSCERIRVVGGAGDHLLALEFDRRTPSVHGERGREELIRFADALVARAVQDVPASPAQSVSVVRDEHGYACALAVGEWHVLQLVSGSTRNEACIQAVADAIGADAAGRLCARAQAEADVPDAPEEQDEDDSADEWEQDEERETGGPTCNGTCQPQCDWCLAAHACPDECGGGDECPYAAIHESERPEPETPASVLAGAQALPPTCFGVPRKTDPESAAYWASVDKAAAKTDATARRIRLVNPPVRHVVDTSPTLPRVDPEMVAHALGAEIVSAADAARRAFPDSTSAAAMGAAVDRLGRALRESTAPPTDTDGRTPAEGVGP